MYNELPKKSVIYDMMNKLLDIMKDIGMPFSFLVGDLPTYKLIFELKTENLDKFLNIVPITGAFHQQMSYIYVIYKRFLGFGISDIFVSEIVDRGRVSWPGFESKTLRTGIAMHSSMARSSHSLMI